MLTDFIGLLEGLTVSPWFLPLVFVIALADAVFPVVPSETAVIVGGVAAGFGQISVWSVILAAALGAIAGDSLAYQLGQRTGDFLRRRSPGRALRRFGWAQRALREPGRIVHRHRPVHPGWSDRRHLRQRGHPPAAVAFHRFCGAGRGCLGELRDFARLRLRTPLPGEPHTGFLFAFGSALVLVALAELIRWMLNRRQGAASRRRAESVDQRRLGCHPVIRLPGSMVSSYRPNCRDWPIL